MTHECRMIPFPLSARVGKVRRVAEVYERKTGNDRESYWRVQVTGMRDALQSAGISPDDVNKELTGFKRAVLSELHRRSSHDVQQGDGNPRGAA